MRQPIKNLIGYRDEHHSYNEKIVRYALTKRGRRVLSLEAVENLRDRGALSLKATNASARIALAEAADTGLKAFLATKSVKQLYWITIVSANLSYAFSDTRAFSPGRVQDVLLRLFSDMNYFGMIDVAYFGNYAAPRADIEGGGFHKQKPAVSFHAHIMAWGASEDYIRGMIQGLNSCLCALVPDAPAVVFQVISAKQASAKQMYLLKMATTESLVFKDKAAERIDEATGEVFLGKYIMKGRPIRPGNAAKVHNALAQYTINDLILAGGEGLAYSHAILDSTKQRLEAKAAREREVLENAYKWGTTYG